MSTTKFEDVQALATAFEQNCITRLVNLLMPEYTPDPGVLKR
jgi:hypothetical protein